MENKVTLLDKLWVICEHAGYSDIPYEFCKNDHIYEQEIKQALIDYEQLKKVIEIIKDKKVDFQFFQWCENITTYNLSIHREDQLTQEEYDLLKEVLK